MVFPSLSTLKAATADLVRQAREDGILNKLTVRIVRRELEQKFSLDDGVLDDKEYKTAIKETVIAGLQDSGRPQDAAEQPAELQEHKDAKKKSSKSSQRVPAQDSKKDEGRKRKSKSAVKPELLDAHPMSEVDDSDDSAPPPKKKPRVQGSKDKSEKILKSEKSKKLENNKIKSVAVIESSGDEEESEERKPTLSRSPKGPKTTPSKRQHVPSPKSKTPKKEVKTEDETGMEISGDDGPGPSSSKPKSSSISEKKGSPTKGALTENLTDSELSSVIDEPPKKHQKNRHRNDTVKEEKQEKGKGRKKTKEPLSKDEETVVRLKAMVVACGVRKTWKKEFKDMENPSQQVKRLQEILAELGMKPRYSLEKAKAIRQRRELAQELKDVQEFDQATRRRDRKKGKHRSDTKESVARSDSDVEDVPAKKKSARASIMAFLQDQSDEE